MLACEEAHLCEFAEHFGGARRQSPRARTYELAIRFKVSQSLRRLIYFFHRISPRTALQTKEWNRG